MELLSLAIVGAAVSLLVQGIKKVAGTSEYWTLLAVVAVSLAAGFIYTAAKGTHLWETFTQVLVYAGAVYTFLIQRFNKPSA